MRVEAWIAGFVAAFFVVVTPIYWFLSKDPTGTSALVMSALLGLLMTFFLAVVSKQIPRRPEDRADAEVLDGAGELGFFPPYSWWPLYCAGAAAVCVLGIAIGWWLLIIGAGLGVVTLLGWIFEYYRGYHAH